MACNDTDLELKCASLVCWHMRISFLALQVLLYSAAIFLMAACSTTETAAETRQTRPVAGVFSDTTYLCRNDRLFTAHFDRTGEKAALLFQGNSRTLLRAAAEPVFADSFYTLYIEDSGLMHLDRFGVPIMENCAAFRA